MATTCSGLDISERTQSRATSRARSTGSGVSGTTSFVLHPFGFDAKMSLDATDSLIKTRSASFVLKAPPKDDDIWKRPPPDFRPQCYAPRPPARNSRDAMNPWRYGPLPGDPDYKPLTRQSAPVRLPDILLDKEEQMEQFVTAFTLPGPWEAKLLCAREGVFKPEKYRMPKPHDFRGYPKIQSLGLPEFVTDSEADPYNLRFLSDHLDILPGDGPVRREDREIKGQQMAPPLPVPPQWERRLILDQEPFPNKYKAYTRHRRPDRTPHSALMEKVEDRLNASWAKRQLDQQLQQHRVRRKPEVQFTEQIGDYTSVSVDDAEETDD